MSIVRYPNDVIPWTDRLELAKVVANTDFVPKALRGNPPAIMAAILYGDEVGFGPMQSLSYIAVIEGKPTLSAEAQRALILQAGHEITIEEATVTKVTVAGKRRDSDHTVRVTWTMDDAKRAGIAGRHNWRAYPRQMLIARATAELARAVFADAIGGLAATEEFEGSEDGGSDAAAPEAAPAATTRKRRRARTSPVATSAPPAEPTPPEAPILPGDTVMETGSGGQFDDERPALPPEPESKPPLYVSADEIDGPDEEEPTGDDRPVNEAVKHRLNVLVGILRDRGGYITTEQIYHAVGTLRRVNPTVLALEVGGVDDEGRLHWGPLRDRLTWGEARQLGEWFTIKSDRITSAPADTPLPLPDDVRDSLQPPPLPGEDD